MPPKGAKKATYPCLVCESNVTKKTGGVRCEFCERWGHAKCCNISAGHLKCLEEMENASWKCNPCMGVSKKIKQEINHIQLKQAEMKASIDANTGNILNHDRRIEIMENKIDKVNKEDIVQSSKEAVMEELREQRARRNNLVIHQIPEPPSNLASGWQCKEYDINYVIDLFKFLGAPINKDGFKFIYRPGEKQTSGRPRPVIFCLTDPNLRTYILENTRKLANSTYSSISIIPDLTQEQRKEEDKLRKCAEQRNREMDPTEATNWEWVLIGMRGDRRMIKRRVFQGESQDPRKGGQRGPIRNHRGQNPLTGANSAPILRPTVSQPMREAQGSSQERQISTTQLRSRSRELDLTIQQQQQQQQRMEIPPTLIVPPEPTTPSFMIPLEEGGGGEEEEDEEEDIIEVVKTPGIAMSLADLPTDEEEEEEEVQEESMEGRDSEVRGEPQKSAKEAKKRARQDSKSPPNQSQTKKKPAKF